MVQRSRKSAPNLEFSRFVLEVFEKASKNYPDRRLVAPQEFPQLRARLEAALPPDPSDSFQRVLGRALARANTLQEVVEFVEQQPLTWEEFEQREVDVEDSLPVPVEPDPPDVYWVQCDCCGGDLYPENRHEPYSRTCISNLLEQLEWLRNRPPSDNDVMIHRLVRDQELALAKRYQNWVNNSLGYVIGLQRKGELSSEAAFMEIVKRLHSLDDVIKDALARESHEG